MSILERIRKRMIEGSIRKSLLVVFVVVFLCPVLIISLIYISSLYKTLLDNELDKVQTSLVQTEHAFVETLNDIRTLSDSINENTAISDLVLHNIPQDLSYLTNYLYTNSTIANFRIYVETSNPINSPYFIKATHHIIGDVWYKTACLAKGTPFWFYKTDSVDNKQYLCLVRALYTNGEFVGVLVININPQVMNAKFNNQIYTTFIEYNNQILYKTDNRYKDEEIKDLFDLISKENYQEYNIYTKIGYERVLLVPVDFYPTPNYSFKFIIMYLVPVSQLMEAVKSIIILSVIVLIVMVGLSFVVIMLFTQYLNIRVTKVQNGIDSVVRDNFEISSSIGGTDEFSRIYARLYEMSGKIKVLIDQVYKQNLEKEQIAARQSEMSFKMLSNQINPHFLFNTLETIRMKALSQGDKEISTMLKILAHLLRFNLSVKGKPVPLVDEMNAVQNYLKIQHMRFGDRITYNIESHCDMTNLTILPLVIQPIVENSFSHGLEDRVMGGLITIVIEAKLFGQRSDITITVNDNGTGIEPEKLIQIRNRLDNPREDDNSSIGIYNVNSRIKLFYAEGSGIKIDSIYGEGTTVTITLREKS